MPCMFISFTLIHWFHDVSVAKSLPTHCRLEPHNAALVGVGGSWPHRGHVCTHYSDVIMSTMVSHFTGIRIVYSTVCSGAGQRKHQSSVSLAVCEGNSPVTGELPAQRASDAENFSIWWHHCGYCEISNILYSLLFCNIQNGTGC